MQYTVYANDMLMLTNAQLEEQNYKQDGKIKNQDKLSG